MKFFVALFLLGALAEVSLGFANLGVPFTNIGTKRMAAIRMATSDGFDLNAFIQITRPFRPIVGFYAVMLAPIYGIGLPFFGSITDFSTLKNRNTPNEYIVCPQDITPARVNDVAPFYKLSKNDLRDKVEAVVKRQPRITSIASTGDKLEFVQRSLILRFPDVITFEFLPVEGTNGKETTLAAHSYSIYGAGDLGVNKDRLTSWLRELQSDIDASQ